MHATSGREGDGRSPAGAFAVGAAFGYADSAITALPYEPMDANDWCIDVSASLLYNRIVDAAEVGVDAIAGSTEPDAQAPVMAAPRGQSRPSRRWR